jgi:hypothetical protein
MHKYGIWITCGALFRYNTTFILVAIRFIRHQYPRGLLDVGILLLVAISFNYSLRNLSYMVSNNKMITKYLIRM